MEDVLGYWYVLLLFCGAIYLLRRLLTKPKETGFKLDSTHIIQAERKAQKKKESKNG